MPSRSPRRLWATCLVAIQFAALVVVPTAGASRAGEVDPLFGVAGAGHTVPGPQLPFGFANPSPDTWPSESSGYRDGAPIRGFSQTHVSGTGGAGRYGNFRLSPVRGTPDLEDLTSSLASPASEERSEPGYYTVWLRKPAARAELTASRRAAYHRYRFTSSDDAGVLLDVTSHVDPEMAGVQTPVRSSLTRTGARTFVGSTRMKGGWGVGGYTLYVAVETSERPTGVRIFRGSRWLPGSAAKAGRERLGALLEFGRRRPVEFKVGVSFVSRAKARSNMSGELEGGFEVVRKRARQRWQRALRAIDVTGGTAAQRRIFATALYHSSLMPHDVSGENVWWRSAAPHYEDYYTLWDTFRTVHPLLTLIQPRRQAQMVQSLVETYEHTGWMPDARIAGNNGLTQGGSNGDVLVADALAKRLAGIDYRAAYRALKKNAEVDSNRPLVQGRELRDYKRLGYLPTPLYGSASRTMEYAYNDFAVAQVARRYGTPGEARRLLARSRNWRNLWRTDTRTVAPRTADGEFAPGFEPLLPYHALGTPFYEGNALHYTTYVPHDARALIDRLGGDAAAVDWLDGFFRRDADHGYDPGNEPGLLAPFLYIHAGRADRTAERVRHIQRFSYRADRDALPGNDDSGALSAWYVWTAIGLYPNAGQPFYYVTTPLFARAHIRLARGRSFTVVARHTSARNAYVTGARLNDAPLCRAWLTHDEIAAGGKLELRVGPRPNGWGDCARPPSLGR
jgi:predicted alpha-1,2-mannosidase